MTLTELSYYTRKILPVLIIGFFVSAFLSLFIIALFSSNQKNYEEQISYKPIFGKLNRISITESLPFPENAEFILDNIEGKPVTATTAANVYFIPKTKTRFGYLETIYQMAKSASFNTEVVRHRLNGSVASFDDDFQTLVIDIGSFNFSYKYRFEDQPDVFLSPQLPPNDEEIKEKAREFLDRMGRFPQELRNGRESVTYFLYDPYKNDFIVTENREEATAVEIDFFRPDENGIPVFSTKYFAGNNFVVFAFPEGNEKVLKAQVQFFEKDSSSFGVYPVKTGEEAWNDLTKRKKGFIITNHSSSKKITITDMFIGYLDPDIYQPYFQPIYVFIGENNFVAYIQAVKDEYIE